MDNEKKAPEEEKDNKPEGETETEPETDETASDDKQADENGEGAAAEPEQAEQPAEETPAEEQTAEETAPDATAELEQLRAENARLKAQLEAHNAGFKAEYIEDAVLIAENAANRDGITITEALQAVAKKYPEWKHTADDKGRNGFKVGAETPKEDDTAEDDKLNEAFGIRKK